MAFVPADGPMYLTPWDEHSCAFAPIEPRNKQDKKRKKKKKKEKKVPGSI